MSESFSPSKIISQFSFSSSLPYIGSSSYPLLLVPVVSSHLVVSSLNKRSCSIIPALEWVARIIMSVRESGTMTQLETMSALY